MTLCVWGTEIQGGLPSSGGITLCYSPLDLPRDALRGVTPHSQGPKVQSLGYCPSLPQVPAHWPRPA